MSSSTSDSLQELPSDKIPPTQEEKEMMSWLFSEPRDYVAQTSSKLIIEFQTILWLGLLFLVLSFPQVNHLLQSWFPITKDSFLLTSLLKTVLFIIIAWVIAYLFNPKQRS